MNPIEKFRQAACCAFPDCPQLASIELTASLKTAWQKLASVAGVSIPVFAKAISAETKTPLATSLRATPEALRVLPATGVRKNLCLPVALDDGVLSVVIANPCDDELIKFIRFAKSDAQLLLAPPEEIDEAIQIAYSHQSMIGKRSSGLLVLDPKHPAGRDEHAVIRLAKQLLQDVVALGASDLHLQPFLGGGAVRTRVDGMLRRVALLPEPVYLQLARYIKANSGMDPSNNRTPQDGRLSLDVEGRNFDLRISALPARGGERIVIRFLDQSSSFQLTRNGFSTAEIQSLRRLSRNSSGLVLLTGPTGSGKTTTLYALLGELSAPYRNIITVENPVEYVLPGLSQVDVNEKAGLTFASALRSVLRQDPDVLLIGEIRDEETADIAFQAALTGHLVFSTLHTNDALSTIPRLLDLGVQPTILADTLVGIVAQRLCRRLCSACRIPIQEDTLRAEEAAFKTMTRVLPPYRAAGCEDCGYTGYAGRFPITEIIEPPPSLRSAITRGSGTEWSAGPLGLNNLSSLSSSAARHIVSGDTSVDEAVRVIGWRFWSALATEYRVDIPDIAFSQEESQESHAPGVLILGIGGTEDDLIAAELERAWFSVFTARSSAEAKTQLQSHDNIVHVIVNLDDRLSDQELVAYIRQARVDMYWSRLPALLLLPPRRDGLEAALIADGATAPCLMKPVLPAEIVRFARMALAKEHPAPISQG